MKMPASQSAPEIDEAKAIHELTRAELEHVSLGLTHAAGHRLVFDCGHVWLIDLETESSLKLDRSRTVGHVFKMALDADEGANPSSATRGEAGEQP